ncbi:hypothetical protein MseVgp188 [Melanoplus sanguinipes entomopoxvirus]|uniref:Uncharacterized protein n=1 Tax=Melanoplus sanguinipes entomopoxvirus TaxID=83191 RepID=Q9YVQ4_MSEPV|nr:hypothetical protein MseVgp188 [Melanoplus sanguinipes entomopoxvirus]AAC97695.1 ORF MSV188 hypothetical protein [Melanoplus sanguinipes entomopoxvirus 'O']
MIFDNLHCQGVDMTYYLYLKFIKKENSKKLREIIEPIKNNMVTIYLETVIVKNTLRNKDKPIEYISPI